MAALWLFILYPSSVVLQKCLIQYMQIYLYCCGRLAGDIEKYRSWGRLTTFIRLIAKYIVCFSSYHQIISCEKSADVRKTGSGNSSGDFNNKESYGLHSNFISAQNLWFQIMMLSVSPNFVDVVYTLQSSPVTVVSPCDWNLVQYTTPSF